MAHGKWQRGLGRAQKRRRVQGCKSWRVEGGAPRPEKHTRAKRAKFFAKGAVTGWQCRMPLNGLASG